MSDIKITEHSAKLDSTRIIEPAKISGYIVFCRVNGGTHWSNESGNPSMLRDYARFPFPLLPTKEAAIEAAKRYLPNGGDVKIFKVEE